MTTFCDACDNVHSDTRKDAPWRWRCVKAPVVEQGYRFVSQDYAPAPPYHKCDHVNGNGECEMFTPRREGKKDKAA